MPFSLLCSFFVVCEIVKNCLLSVIIEAVNQEYNETIYIYIHQISSYEQHCLLHEMDRNESAIWNHENLIHFYWFHRKM